MGVASCGVVPSMPFTPARKLSSAVHLPIRSAAVAITLVAALCTAAPTWPTEAEGGGALPPPAQGVVPLQQCESEDSLPRLDCGDVAEGSDEGEASLLKVSMLQASLNVYAGRRPSQSLQPEALAPWGPGEGAVEDAAVGGGKALRSPGKGEVKDHAEGMEHAANASVPATGLQGFPAELIQEISQQECLVSLTPLHLKILLDTLRALGSFPADAPCGLGASATYASLLQFPIKHARNVTVQGFSHPLVASWSHRTREALIITAYITFYMITIALLYFWMKSPPHHLFRPVSCTEPRSKRITNIDVEEETWQQGVFGWLAVSWASPWVARWGHSHGASNTRIKAGELPQLGNRDLQADAAAEHFERLWGEEVVERGEEQASVGRVITKVWTIRSMVYLLAISALRISFQSIYGVLLVQHSLQFYSWLQRRKMSHPGESIDLTMPLLLVIGAFSLLPFSQIVLNSAMNAAESRLDQRLCGGLAVALFRKAQRLPANALIVEDSTLTNSGLRSQFRQGPVQEQQEEFRPNLASLINYDVMSQALGAYTAICSALTALIANVALVILLWTKLRCATLCCLAISTPVVCAAIFLSSGLGRSLKELQECMDKRVSAVREVLYGMKIIKCYAWEEPMEEKISAHRAAEVRCMLRYYHYLGSFLGITMCFPRLIILAGLSGYAVIYGAHDVTTIFVSLQILGGLKVTFETLTQAAGRVASLAPTFGRIEAFLKLQEAPLLPPEKKPTWVQLWPQSPEVLALAEAAQPIYRRPVPPPTVLRVHGTFAWEEGGTHVLRDLNLDVPRGQLVAVVGQVGSGKSTLMMAVLGELCPDQAAAEALISRSEMVAYCPQVPHIAEGTLRDNVIFGQHFDPDRYSKVMRAACLEEDLKVLPGGEYAPCGARGIALSGGQKARISLARAAYHYSSDLVLIDDPFAAVDAPTAKNLMERLLTGPFMRERTRLVAMQPDVERLRKCDHVVILSNGRIEWQGAPEEATQTQAFQELLSSKTAEVASLGGPQAPARESHALATRAGGNEPGLTLHSKLRDDELEGRPTWKMIKQYIDLGRWRNLVGCSFFYFVMMSMYLLCDLALASWCNRLVGHPDTKSESYLRRYLFWLVVGSCFWIFSWKFTEWFSHRISSEIHNMLMARLLRAPLDRFFDKHPVGRIINRISADMAIVDLFLFLKLTYSIGCTYNTLLPLIFVHTILPWFVTIMAIPLYLVMWIFCSRFWNTVVPLRYCMTTARSDVNSLVTDVSNNNVTLRAYREQDRIAVEMCDAVDNMLKACLLSDRTLRRWLMTRIYLMWSFYTTTMYIVAMCNSDIIGAGTLGLCITLLLILGNMVETNLDSFTGAQFEFIALARINEYLHIPQEKSMRNLEDAKYESFQVRFPRVQLGKLALAEERSGSVQVRRDHRLLLESTADGTALLPAKDSAGLSLPLSDVCPEQIEHDQRWSRASWHRIVGVNDAFRSARSMAQELCGGSDWQVVLDVQSSWLADGAQVTIENLKAGYADIPRDVLKGINLKFEARSKVGIVGTTGCGKSSLLLAFLRVLEPRAGRILLNGVDTRDVGLATLRTAVGLVPQDPLLFTGTLRYNVDPFGRYSDGRIWTALATVQLKKFVEETTAKLRHMIAEDGANLSMGQRQLICLARMVLRQPPVLLLDEATSAIDPNTQEAVQNTIQSAFPSSTLIAVAHRLETILDFDQVVVLDSGDVAEQGPVKEMSQREGGALRRMLRAKADNSHDAAGGSMVR